MSNFLHLTGPFKKSMMARRERSNQYAFLRMVLCIKVNGSQMKIKRMVVESKFGQMDLDMMDSGETEWQMGTEDSFMPKVMCMKENGPKIKPTDMESILILMEVDMKDNGSKISSTDSV